MKKVFLLSCALACLIPHPAAGDTDPAGGTHELTGPVSVRWSTVLDGPEVGYDPKPAVLAAGPDGRSVFVTASLRPEGELWTYFAVFAYDSATGKELWRASPGGHLRSVPRAIAANPVHDIVYVTGESELEDRLGDYLTLAYDGSTGEQRWSARYVGPDTDWVRPGGIVVSPDGGTVFVTGTAQRGGYRAVTVAYDALAGTELWTAQFDGSLPENRRSSLAASPDGKLVLVTGNFTADTSGCVTVAYEAATGSEVWRARYDGPFSGPHRCYATSIAPDGARTFVTGRSLAAGGLYDCITFALDTKTGTRLWSASHPGAYPLGAESECRWNAVTPDGATVLSSGFATGNKGWDDFLLVAYDAASGAELWSSRLDAPEGHDRTAAIAVSPANDVAVVTGTVENFDDDRDRDYLTIGYDLGSGEILWTARYDGPVSGREHVYSVAFNPDGMTAYVSGARRIEDRLGYFDFHAVAYSVALPWPIDLNPDAAANRVNPRGPGEIAVALLGSQALRVAEVDLATLRLGPDNAGPIHDLSDAFTRGDHLRDVNLDGYPDLLLHFRLPETGIACGDETVTLAGSTLEGFPIRGTDSVTTIGCRGESGLAQRPGSAAVPRNPREEAAAGPQTERSSPRRTGRVPTRPGT